MIGNEQQLWVVERAKALGFDLCGVVALAQFPELARVEEWLAQGYAGEMKYLEDPRRKDPRNVLANAKTAIVCAMNYNTGHPRSIEAFSASTPNSESPSGWISRYAWGNDYHEVLWTKLDVLVEEMRREFPPSIEFRAYADTGPLNERVLAKHAGLGWLGKNTLLLNSELGSFFFLGVILTTAELVPVAEEITPQPDLCGTCRKCIDACPTGALVGPYVMDARRCISYLTIELRGGIAEELREPLGTHLFGCDICQDVCPWNRKAPVTKEGEFHPRVFATGRNGAPADENASLLRPSLEWLASLSEDEFREKFRGSAIKRTKWRGLVRNACIALGNSRITCDSPSRTRIGDLLRRLAASSEKVIAESAQWALSRI
jgi:epoxyqueuosine reductase